MSYSKSQKICWHGSKRFSLKKSTCRSVTKKAPVIMMGAFCISEHVRQERGSLKC